MYAQGLTRAIDYLAAEAGLSESERRELVTPHALNPAVLHARIFGGAPLTKDTVLGAFVEGARVRADSLGALADRIGGAPLGGQVRGVLLASPPPADEHGDDPVAALRDTYAAQERAAVMIAASETSVEGIAFFSESFSRCSSASCWRTDCSSGAMLRW